VIRKAWAKKFAARRGLSEQEVERITTQVVNDILPPELELEFDNLGTCTVADVITNPDKYVGETLADPIEGIEYGRNKAMVLRRGDGTLWINSFAHGGIKYEFADYKGWFQQVGCNDDLLTFPVRFFNGHAGGHAVAPPNKAAPRPFGHLKKISRSARANPRHRSLPATTTRQSFLAPNEGQPAVLHLFRSQVAGWLLWPMKWGISRRHAFRGKPAGSSRSGDHLPAVAKIAGRKVGPTDAGIGARFTPYSP
jgi:hypothetical protein